MAFPTIPLVADGRILFTLNTAGGATKTFPDLSSLTKNAGDLLIAIIIEYDGNSTNAEFSSWGGSFTEFVDQAGTATMAIGAAYKWSTGSETGTFTVTTADTSTNDSVLILMSIPGAHATTPPEAGAMVTGTAPDAAALAPSWGTEDALWIAVAGCGETSTTGSFTGITTPPTNYGNEAQSGITADVVGGVEGSVAFRQATDGNQDPGPWAMDTSNTRGAALLIAVRPSAAQQFNITPAGSITPTGALVKAVNKPLGGGITPTGALAKAVAKFLGGSITPTGTLVTLKLFTVLLGGSITPTGTLRKDVVKAVGGTVTPTGGLAKAALHFLAGAIVPTGALAKRVDKPTAGAITPAGTVTKAVDKRLGGTITPAGALRKAIAKFLAGGITPTGTLRKDVVKFLVGAITPTGTLGTLFTPGGGGGTPFTIDLAGGITPAGTLVKSVAKNLAGGVTPAGAITKNVGKFLAGSITPSGSIRKAVGKFLGGVIAPIGNLISSLFVGGAARASVDLELLGPASASLDVVEQAGVDIQQYTEGSVGGTVP